MGKKTLLVLVLISLLLVLSVNSVSAAPTIQNMSVEYTYDDSGHNMTFYFNLTEEGVMNTVVHISKEGASIGDVGIVLNSSYIGTVTDCSQLDDGEYVLNVDGWDGFEYYFTKNQVIQDSRIFVGDDTAVFNVAGPLDGVDGTISIDGTSVLDRYFLIVNNRIIINDSSIGNLGLGTYHTSFIINGTWYDANLIIPYEYTVYMDYNRTSGRFYSDLSSGLYNVEIFDLSNELLYSKNSASVSNGYLSLDNLPLTLFPDEYVLVVSNGLDSHYYKLVVNGDEFWNGVEFNVDYKFNTSLTVYIRTAGSVPDNISFSILGTNITDKVVGSFVYNGTTYVDNYYDDQLYIYKSIIVLDDLKYLYKDVYKVVSLWDGKLYPAYLYCLSNGYYSISEDEPSVELHNIISGTYNVDIINSNGISRNMGDEETDANNNLLISNLPDHLRLGDNYIRLTNVDSGEIFSYNLYVNPVGDINASEMLIMNGSAEFNTTLPNSDGGSAIIYQNMILVDSISNVNVSEGKIIISSDKLSKLDNGYYDVTFILNNNYYYTKLLIKDLGIYTIDLGTQILDMGDSGIQGSSNIKLIMKNGTMINLGIYTDLDSISLPLLFDDEYLLILENNGLNYPYTLKIRPYNTQSINQGENGLMKLFMGSGNIVTGLFDYQIINKDNIVLKVGRTKFVYHYYSHNSRYCLYYGGSINSSDLSPGVYMVKFTSSSGGYCVKLIVNPELSDKVIGLSTSSVSFNFTGLDNEEGLYTINNGIEEYLRFKLLNGQVTIPTDTLSSGVYYVNFIFDNGITSGAYIFKNYTRYHVEINCDNPIYGVFGGENSFIITLKDENNNTVPSENITLIEHAYDEKGSPLDITQILTDNNGRIYVNSYNLAYGRTDTDIVYLYQGSYTGGWSRDAAYYVMDTLVTYSKTETIESFSLDSNISETGDFIISNNLRYVSGSYSYNLTGQTLYVYVDDVLYGSFSSDDSQYRVSGLSKGVHTIRVSYQGNLSNDLYAYSEASQDVLVKYYSYLNLTLNSGNISKVGENISVLINLTNSTGQGIANKTVTLYDQNDLLYSCLVGDTGLIQFNIILGAEGYYDLYVKFDGDSDYLNSTSSVVSLKLICDTHLDIGLDDNIVDPGEFFNVYVNLTKVGDGTGISDFVRLYSGDVEIGNLTTDNNGAGVLSVNFSEPGKYNLYWFFDGDDLFVNSSSNIRSLTVRTPTSLSFNLSNNYSKYNQIVNITFNIGVENKTIHVYNGTKKITNSTSNSSGSGLISLNLPVGDYNLYLKFDGDGDYMNSTSNMIFLRVVWETFLNMNITGNNSRYSEDISILFNLSTIDGGLQDKIIYLYNNNTIMGNYTTNNEGIVNESLKLNSGEYNLSGKYNNETFYIGSHTSTYKLIINKMDTKIQVNNITRNMSFGETLQANISLLDSHNNPIISKNIELTYNSVIVNLTTDNNGNILFSIPDLHVGNYSFNLSFIEDNNYLNSSNSSSMTVNRLENPQLILNVMSSSFGVAPKVSVKLTDTKNNPINGGIIEFKVNNKPYTNLTTNNFGVASFNINNAGIGTYTVSANLISNEDIASANKTNELSVTRAPTSIIISAGTISTKHKVTIKVTLKNSKTGEIIPYKRIRLRINGKNYYKTSNSAGVATFYISKLRKTSYKTYAYYNGDKNYLASSKSVSVTKKADLYVYKVRRSGNRYTITIRNRGSRASTTTYLKVYYTKSKRTYSKIVKVYGIKIGKTRKVYVNLGRYSAHKRYYKYAYINYPRPKRLVESNYNNNIKKFRI